MTWARRQTLWIQAVLCALFLTGCAFVDRACSSCAASAVGSDWVVVKNDLYGKPFRCWMLKDVSMASETNSDGVYWKSPEGHLVHISGNYDYVQVQGGDSPAGEGSELDGWDVALSELGLTKAGCTKLRNRSLDPL